MMGNNSYLIALLGALALAGCHSDLGEPLQSGRVLPWLGLQGRWIGPVASEDKTCGKPRTGVLTVGRTDFVFDPFQSTILIRGQVGADKRLAGTLTQPGGEHQTLSISFDATPHRDASGSETIVGTVVSGRCTWSMTLARG